MTPDRATQLRGQSVLITGATGFIGCYLGEYLAAQGITLYGLSRTASAQTLPAGVIPLAVDIQQREAVIAAFQQARPDRVIHLAAVGVTDPFLPFEEAVEINVRGTIHVLEASQNMGVRRFVHIGTAYERSATETERGPGNPYVASKLGAWSFWRTFVQKYALNSVALRLFHVYGPRQPERGLIAASVLSALRGETLRLTPGEQIRDFIYVTDVVQSIVAAAATFDCHTQTYEAGTGDGRSVKSVVAKIFEIINGSGRYEIGALPYRPHEEMRLVAQPHSAASDLGWHAQIAFEEGLSWTIESYRNERQNYE
jgi:UDP-glucose 4-epimerase